MGGLGVGCLEGGGGPFVAPTKIGGSGGYAGGLEGLGGLKLDGDFLSFIGIQAFSPEDRVLGVKKRQVGSRLSVHTGP